MAFGLMADYDDTIDVVFFPDFWDENKKDLELDQIYKMEGKLTERNNDRSVLVDRITKL